ncbi:hypothetical protein BDV11DRAFT_201066 [Aspergillus similis]
MSMCMHRVQICASRTGALGLCFYLTYPSMGTIWGIRSNLQFAQDAGFNRRTCADLRCSSLAEGVVRV